MGLMFDNIDLEATYGLVVDGASTWPKPERDVEYVHVPGRNGDILMDNGCWQNVEITYTFLIKDNWKAQFEDFAAWLCSHVGYFRLEDQDRHPGVYRMASFTGPIEPELWFTTDTGVFELTFNCKPQQFLLSGDAPLHYFACKIGFDVGMFEASNEYMTSPGIKLSAGQKVTFRFKPTAFVSHVRPQMSKNKVYFSGNTRTWEGGDYVVGAQGLPAINNTAAGAIGEMSYTLTENDVLYNGESYPYIAIGAEVTGGVSQLGTVWIGIDDVFYEVIMVPAGNTNWSYTATITNPTGYESKPLIQKWLGTSKINDYTLVYTDPAVLKGSIFVDCELEDCYSESGGVVTNANDKVTITNSNAKELRDFPYLKAGSNTLQIIETSKQAWIINCGQIDITPRWYRI